MGSCTNGLFWSSVELTGNQTGIFVFAAATAFWSSVELTGNQTVPHLREAEAPFWSSVELTGNQTRRKFVAFQDCFGAVSN